MYTLLEAQNLVEKHIKTISIPDTPPELYEPVKYILSLGGKRIRPALVILGLLIVDVARDMAGLVKEASGLSAILVVTLGVPAAVTYLYLLRASRRHDSPAECSE